jgi:HSP20 family protein
MKLTKYRPLIPEFAAFPQFGEMPARMQRIFDDFLAAPPTTQFGWTPDVDIIEEEKELLLTAELPGMKKEDVQLEIAEGTLTLKGEKKVEKEKKEGTYRVFERSYGAFERSFVLPRSVDPNNIKADFEDGVLKIHLPKTEKAQGRRVEISAK